MPPNHVTNQAGPAASLRNSPSTTTKSHARHPAPQTTEPAPTSVPAPRTEHVLTTLLQLATLVRRRLADALQAHGVSWAQYEVIELLNELGPLSYISLSRQLNRHRTSITATVARLAKAGFVELYPNHRRPQQVLVTLTDKGHSAAHKAQLALAKIGTHFDDVGFENNVMLAQLDLLRRTLT